MAQTIFSIDEYGGAVADNEMKWSLEALQKEINGKVFLRRVKKQKIWDFIL